ncbi:RNA-dependent RNA polymerase 5 [Pyrus ussuriensis x Pyrus communis]|uniref:RNA-dependent RNA polymerase n=1 Tax=Pyrus ussuriensis x Pyrus communis TaxID=2448454 RepID=A0A5N5GT74_9ROSA|nr:RNA-dependent RNA polymerase 5 [Pyrus ussuriensis x Pyrus communis]
MLRQEKYRCAPHSPSPPPSPSPSPSKSAPAASRLLHSPSSASSITPGRQEHLGDCGGGVRPLYSSCPSHSPSEVARTSLFQAPSSAAPSTSLTPVRLSQGEALTNRSADQPGDDGRAQLEALGELEFRKQFLILNYAGGEKLENVLAPETIRSWKGMPMQQFENTVWDALGSKYTRKEDRQCGPYQRTTKRTLLQKILGDDSILMVKFADAVNDKDPRKKMGLYVDYSKVAREGILVGLRQYCFFVFKDGGNKEKKKCPTSSPVKCYFVRVGSNATIDRGGDYIISNRTAHKARCIFMHPHTVSSVSNYMIRFSLILSKTESLKVENWSLLKIDDIDDDYCLDEYGNRIYRDGKPLIHSDGTGFISEDLALLCPKDLLKKEEFTSEYFEPLLMQFRLFYKGRAVKGTFLVNKKLPPKTIQIRPSMIKVETDRQMLDDKQVNSLEIVGVSKKPRNTKFSRNLIALLCHGGVPKEYFMELLMKDLENTRGVFCNKHAAAKVALNYGGMDDDYLSFKMISSGIPLEESYLQHRLSFLKREENNSLKKGKISSPQSYMLMGTTDPTGMLEKDEVCVLLDSGPIQGEVLVYRHPGLHFGDVHVLKATYVAELKEFVGNSGFAIFFSRKGSRSIADEIAGGDFDGDLYWVSRNPRLLECFKQSKPWIDTSSTPKAATTSPPVPSALLPDHIEDALFKQFLTARFEPSFAVGAASDYWLAYMDEYLTLGDGHEKRLKGEKMLRLVDLYYDALDAPKKDRTVKIPNDLKPESFPHYMGKPNSYRSTSILGSIYDAVEEYQPEDTSDKVAEKLPCFDVEDLPKECLKKWDELYKKYRSEMNCVLQNDDKEGKNKAADKIIGRYKEILYGCEDFEKSTKPLDEIFNEALAIYRFAYDYAWKVNDVGRCGFAWKVAGSALCKYYKTINEDRTFEVSFSVLRDIL